MNIRIEPPIKGLIVLGKIFDSTSFVFSKDEVFEALMGLFSFDSTIFYEHNLVFRKSSVSLTYKNESIM